MISSTDSMVMPVAPFAGGYGNSSGLSGDWSSWIILFLIFAMFGGGFGGNGGFGGGNSIYPWLNQSNQINDGFRDQMINSTINGIQNGITGGFGDVQNSLCAGFAGVNAAITNSQLSALERSFAAQTANTSALSNLSAQLSQCCCDNRLATCQTQNIVASESAATRLAIQEQTQAILDKMCQQEVLSISKTRHVQSKKRNVLTHFGGKPESYFLRTTIFIHKLLKVIKFLHCRYLKFNISRHLIIFL